jgi:hypothetical protein
MIKKFVRKYALGAGAEHSGGGPRLRPEEEWASEGAVERRTGRATVGLGYLVIYCYNHDKNCKVSGSFIMKKRLALRAALLQ